MQLSVSEENTLNLRPITETVAHGSMAQPMTRENFKKLVQVEAGWTPPVPGFSRRVVFTRDIPAEAGIHLSLFFSILEPELRDSDWSYAARDCTMLEILFLELDLNWNY